VDGWRSVGELTQWGFAHAPVVMANEAHDGLTRSIRTRESGIRIIEAAHATGVRRLAMEALPWPARGVAGPIRVLPARAGGYLAQPDMRRLITTAMDLGWTLWAYDPEVEITAGADPAALLTMEYTNWRDREQAQNLSRLVADARGEPLLVWYGGGHAAKVPAGKWVTMGCHFPGMSGVEAFVIDQTVTVERKGRPRPGIPELLGALSDVLAAYGGTAGILREQAPPPLDAHTGVDAVVVSTDNALT
jgi:hypothetical protein